MMDEKDLVDLDANAALAELDRGMQSTNVADQSAAIVKVPLLFSRFPFPIFINASVLKLAELFRSGTNFSRQLIVRVAEKTELHLEKLISVETIGKRILTVSHSNDPIARALTLRMLGNLASVMKDQKNIHHWVISSLDSQDLEELNGAVSAVTKYSRHSVEFSRAVFDKIAEMLSNISVPMDTKLTLISIFKQMKTDAATADKIFQFCSTDLLQKAVDNLQIVMVLDTLTHLTVLSLFHISEQLDLLIKTFNRGYAKSVKLFTLKCMLRIALQSPHSWFPEQVGALCNICEKCGDTKLVSAALEILCSLCKSPCVSMFVQSNDIRIAPLCQHLLSTDSEQVVIKSLVIQTHFSINAAVDREVKDRLVAECFSSLMFFIPTLDWHNDNAETSLKELLNATVLFAVNFPQYASPLTEPLLYCITATHSEKILKMGLQYVGIMSEKCPGSSKTAAGLLQKSPLMIGNEEFLIDNIDIVSSIFLLPFSPQSADDHYWLSGIIQQSAEMDLPINCWKLFKVARRAMRMGHCSVAKDIWTQLEFKLSSQFSRYWIKGVAAACEADSALLDINATFLAALQNCIGHLHRSLLNLRMAQVQKADVSFGLDLLAIRKRFASALVQMLISWNVAKLIPPPTQGNQRPEQRFVNQMQQSAAEFKEITRLLELLKRRCFDADPETLSFLSILQHQSRWLGHEISNFLCNSFQEGPFTMSIDDKIASSCLSAMGKRFGWCVAQLDANRDKVQPFSEESLKLFGSLVETLCRVPLYFPRFFFQPLQRTTLKMEISPKPSGLDVGLTVPSGQQLSLKVEGILSHGGSKPKCFRSVADVILNIRVERVDSAAKSGEVLQKRTELRNDYFSVEFLMSITHTSLIEIDADLIDSEDGEVWNSGAKERLKVTVSGGRRHQQQLATSLSQSTSKMDSR